MLLLKLQTMEGRMRDGTEALREEESNPGVISKQGCL